MLPFSFTTDSMHIFMAGLAVFMWVMTALASPEYFEHANNKARYYVFYIITLFALVGVFLAKDLLTLFTFFEIMSFTSYVWVAQNETEEAIRAGETYLYIAVIGGLTMLMGLFLLYSCCNTLDIELLATMKEEIPYRIKLIAGICMLAGFGAKAGMFPLHIWLPKAHPVAPAPASALLSGILTKSGVFGIIAISMNLFLEDFIWGNIIIVCACITMFLGALLAVFSTDLKRTLACSSMSQIGFILSGVSMCVLLGHHGSIAASGTILHMLNHALIKLTLFVAAGVVYFNVHSLDFNNIKGFGKNKPLLMIAFLSGACSIAGIPGFSGYISKTLLHEGIIEYIELSGNEAYKIVEYVFLTSGGLTFAYMARLFYVIFIADKKEGQHQKEKYVGKATSIVLITGAVLMPLLGIGCHAFMDKIASFCIPFFNVEKMHTINYFSLTNLKGAAISVGIGIAVLFIVGMGLLTTGRGKNQQFKQVWPKWADLEDLCYRPTLKLLSFSGAVIARFIETVCATMVVGSINLMFKGAKKYWVPPVNDDFGTYSKKREFSIISKAFSTDLIYAALGFVLFIIAFFVVLIVKT